MCRMLVILSLVGASCAPLVAQSPVRDPQALIVLGTSFVDMGGTAIASLTTHEVVTVEGQDDAGNPLEQTIRLDATGRSVTVTNQTNGVVISISGNTASVTADGTTDSMPEFCMGNADITHLPILSALSNWSDPSVSVRFVGVEQLGGRRVQHVRMQRPIPANQGLPSGYDEPIEFYVDSQTGLLSQMQFVQRAVSDIRATVPVLVQYSNYHSVSGIMVPFSVSYSVSGGDPTTQTVSSFLAQ